VIGMMVAKLIAYLKERPLVSMTIYELLICVLCVTWFFLRNTCDKISIITRFVDVLLCIFLLVIFAYDNGKISAFMNRTKFANLSSYVMYIYLLHYPVRMTLITILDACNFNIGECTGIVEAIMCILISIILSITVKIIMETLNKKLKNKKLENKNGTN
jgi:peptidoglycan/LPS O-acetylase OafA/YrhL